MTYGPHSADFTFYALQTRKNSLSPLQDGQQGGSRGGPRRQIIVWLHIYIRRTLSP